MDPVYQEGLFVVFDFAIATSFEWLLFFCVRTAVV
jgi:hypothetical protein